MGNCQCGDTKLCGDNGSNLNINDILTKGSIFDDVKSNHSIKSSHLSELNIKIKTWQKESYSLFDYENQAHLKEQQIQITGCGFLIRRNNEIHWVEGDHLAKEENDVLLFQIKIEDDSFCLVNNRSYKQQALKDQFEEEEENKNELTTKYHNTKRELSQYQPMEDLEDEEVPIEQEQNIQFVDKLIEVASKPNQSVQRQQQKTYQVEGLKFLRKEKIAINQGLRLRKGDVIKMGRVKFKIREINLENFQDKSQNEKDLLRRYSSSSSSSQSLEGQLQCRVCLSTHVSSNNPLVNPCKCAGTMKYIHLQCLQTWLRSKLHSRHSEFCIIYMWKNLECELCKFNYPPLFKSDDAVYDLVELSKPKGIPYLLLEITQKKYEDCVQPSLDDQGNVNKSNGVYFVQFNTRKELKIGRAHETEVRINDISVSRHHALLKLIDNDVYILDTKSKFGTLVLLQQSIPLKEELNGIETQVGRSVLQFTIGKNDKQPTQVNQNRFESCLRRNVPSDDDVNFHQ